MENKFYTANSETESILYGDELEEGMVVMIEDWLLRGEEESSSFYDQARAEENNQFCKVTRLRKGNLVRFVGEYEDGTLRTRTFNSSYTWIVKKDSIPA